MKSVFRVGMLIGVSVLLAEGARAQSLEEAVQAELNQMNNPSQRPNQRGATQRNQRQVQQRQQGQQTPPRMRGPRARAGRMQPPSGSVGGSSGFNSQLFQATPLPAPVFREEALRVLVPSDPASRSLIEVDELVSKPDLPPPRRYTPVLKELPPSFVQRSYSKIRGNYDITGLDVGGRASFTDPAVITLNSYILDEPPVKVGKISEIELGVGVASVGQAVFVQMEKQASPGDRFSIVREKGKIKDKARGEIGPIVEVGGTLQITEAADESKNIYRALITSSVSPITVGSILVEEELPKVTFSTAGEMRNVETRIIGGEFDSNRNIFGESAVVYLDVGSEAGLEVGDLLPVQALRKTRREDTQVPDWRQSIGLLKVAKVGRSVATAVVIEAQDEIRPGDLTGGQRPTKAAPINYFENESGASESSGDISEDSPSSSTNDSDEDFSDLLD